LRNSFEVLDDGSIVCQGDITVGAEIHLMIGNKDFCKQAAVQAANKVRDALKGRPPRLIIIFESLGRQKLLGRAAFQEVEMIREILGKNTPLVGMYSYGQVAPINTLNNVGRSYLQNESIAILAIE
jgi:hypothetical protein